MVALDRLGWRADSFRDWTTDKGIRVDLFTHCPQTIAKLAARAATAWQWRHLAGRYGDLSGMRMGGDLGPLIKALKGKTGLRPGQCSLLRSAATRTLWSTARRAAEGYQADGTCAACGDEQRTLRHAIWRCPAQAMKRYQEDLGCIETSGASSLEEHALYSHGIIPPPADRAPTALGRSEPQWAGNSRVGVLSGHLYVDGSLLHGTNPVEARAGYGIVMTSLVGVVDATVFGAFTGVIQCIDAAEVYAACVAIKLAMGEIFIYSDSAFFVNGWQRGKAWCTSAVRIHADVWRQLWSAAEDYGIGLINVVKVKGHATQADIDRSVSSPMDKWGNDCADTAAKQGAALHPRDEAREEQVKRDREQADKVIHWVGVGLEDAARSGALPARLTAQEKALRPRQPGQPQLQVLPDSAWHSLCGLATQLAKMHASHSYRYVAPYIFCERCGSYTTDRVRDLGDPCPRKASSSKVAFLRRLLEGCHPRTEVYLGVPHPVDLVALRQELAGRLALRPGR